MYVILSISCKGIQGRLTFVIKMDDFMFNRYIFIWHLVLDTLKIYLVYFLIYPNF